MEKQVHTGGRRIVTRFAMAAAVALLVAAGASRPISAAEVWDGATEHTQIMNNIELVLQYIEQIKNVEQTLRSAKALEKQLEQMDSSALASLPADQISRVAALAGLNRQLNSMATTGQQVTSILRNTLDQADSAGMDLDEFVKMRARLADINADVYADSYKADIARMRQFQQQAASLSKMAGAAGGIESDVQGLQQLVASSVRVEAQMASLNEGISRLSAVATSQAQAKSLDEKQARVATEQQKKEVASKMANGGVTFPSPMDYTGSGSN